MGTGNTHDGGHGPGLISVTLEDDSVLRLQPLVTIELDGCEYIALTPPGDESEDVYFYRFIEHQANEIELLNIESEETLEAVLDEFALWFDRQLARQEESS